MKWSEIPEEQWANHQKYVEDRWKDLSLHAHTWSKESLKIIFLTNAGGAVATLTFIGTASTVRAEGWPWIMLGFFCFALILLQIFHGAQYYKLNWMWDSYRRDVVALFSDKKDWEAAEADDEQRADRFLWLDIFPISAGLCFVIAVVIGFSNYQHLIEKELSNGRVNQQNDAKSAKLPEAKPTAGGSAERESPKNPTSSSTTKEEIKKPAH